MPRRQMARPARRDSLGIFLPAAQRTSERETQRPANPDREGRVGEWGSGAFAEVDSELLPGVYQFGAPDEMIAEGSARAVLLIRFPETVVIPVEINLVAYDPQDAERIGVWSLAGHKRHEFLRQALPRFTEMELALGEQAEKELKAKLNTEKKS